MLQQQLWSGWDQLMFLLLLSIKQIKVGQVGVSGFLFGDEFDEHFISGFLQTNPLKKLTLPVSRKSHLREYWLESIMHYHIF